MARILRRFEAMKEDCCLATVFSLFLLRAAVVSGQVDGIGQCPSVQVDEDFDPNKFSGKWFEVERTYGRGWGPSVRPTCVGAEYYYDGQGKFSTVNTAVLPNGHFNRILGELSLHNRSEPAKMTMKFLARHPEPRPFWVLHVDYDSCAIIYRCLRSLWFHSKYAWIMCRNHSITQPRLATLKSYIQQWTDIPPRSFRRTPCK